MRFSLVIATKARPEPLWAALQSAAATLPADGEVIVVDGDPEQSGRAVVERSHAEYPGLAVRHVDHGGGSAIQRNVGTDVAEGDVVVFIDDDCTIEPGMFAALGAAYADPGVVGATGRIQRAPRAGIVAEPDSRLRWLVLGGGRQGTMNSFGFRRPIFDIDEPRDVEYMPGPLMSARRDVAAAVRFDEQLTNYALGEDDDFSYRVSRRGRVRYEPSARVTHHELGFSQMDRRALDRLRVVNRTYLFRKNFPQTLRAKAAFAGLLAILCVHRVLNREWSGLRGLIEGMGEVRRARGVAAGLHPRSREAQRG
ncbi:MAG TPA: glycosyltransferase family 2 protein [Solirubrobacteraceae bacterium]|jgi:GT2 family glycosyltransferase|nr:glycosyltransferase family 2 protein [Solirubrobacteraceae bacterium]